jgi:hypothetical protein
MPFKNILARELLVKVQVIYPSVHRKEDYMASSVFMWSKGCIVRDFKEVAYGFTCRGMCSRRAMTKTNIEPEEHGRRTVIVAVDTGFLNRLDAD